MEFTKPAKSSKREEDAPNSVEPERECETHKALLTNLVLENIFKYLGYKDLKACRNVGNTVWLKNAKKAWWSRTKIVFRDIDKQEERITDYLNQTEITSEAKNYMFESLKGGVERIWEKLGPSMKHLEIRKAHFQNVEEFRELLFTHCPNLENLVLRDFHFLEYLKLDIKEPLTWHEPEFGQQTNLKSLTVIGEVWCVSWMELLSHFPNLQDLEVDMDTDKIFKVISRIRQHDPKMLKLKRIKAWSYGGGDYDESHRSVLLDPNLALELIKINPGNCRPETLADTLDLHAQTLKELHLKGNVPSYPLIKSPRKPLQILEKLHVDSCQFPLDFFKCTPSLKRAYFGFFKITKNDSRPDPNLKVNTCKDLMVFPERGWEDTLMSDFQFFLNAFPNLEEFHTGYLNNSKFSMICEHLKKLVSFGLTGDVDVVGLLGFDPDSKTSGGTRNPNITDLKDLQRIHMAASRVRCQNTGPEISNASMRNGEVILEELRQLHQLKQFVLRNYQLQGDDQIWKEIFSKYSGR